MARRWVLSLQRSGRIERQGNMNETARIFRYVTESTFDAYLWQTLENKQKFISQIMTSKSPARSADDIDATALSYAEVKALATGDDRIKEKMDLDVQVAKLKLMRSSHQSNCYEMEDRVIKFYPTEIKKTEERIVGLKADLETIKLNPMTTIVESKNEDGSMGAVTTEDNFKMLIGGVTHTERKTVGEAIIEACKEIKNPDEQVDLGEYRGFKMKLFMDNSKFKIALKGHTTQIAELENSVTGNVSRVANLLDGFEGKISNLEARLSTLQTEMQSADEESKRPFPKESEYQEKSARLVQLNKELDNTGKEKKSKEKETETSEKRPSVLEKLKTIGTTDKAENTFSKEQNHDKGSIAI